MRLLWCQCILGGEEEEHEEEGGPTDHEGPDHHRHHCCNPKLGSNKKKQELEKKKPLALIEIALLHPAISSNNYITTSLSLSQYFSFCVEGRRFACRVETLRNEARAN
jgi:hypothetical protein